jgi:rod shape determining protein RodA
MRSYFKEFFDSKLFFVVVAVVGIGLLSIYSATYDVRAAVNFKRQLVFAGFGFVFMLAAWLVPLKTLQRLSFIAYGLTLAILLFVLVYGATHKGAKSWFELMQGFGGQPSEFAKITTVLAAASYFSQSSVNIANLKHFLTGVCIFIVPMGLILAQPDLGTTIVFFIALLPLLYWAGVSNFTLIALIVPILVAGGALFGTAQFLGAAAIGAALLYYFRENRFAAVAAFGITLALGLTVQIMYERLAPYQQKRISTFLNPEADLQGAGYNVFQSKIAIGSGGLLGKGYLHGTQTQLNYIPEQWTDFIFCVPGEEFGFVGASVVLLLLFTLLFHGVNLAAQSKNRYGSIVAIGFTGIWAAHIIINTGMAMALLPVIGIPLPFMSYGGSSLIANMIMAGILMNVYSNRKAY